MRVFNKYKFTNKKHIFPYFFSKRILRFKRTKWKGIIKKINIIKKNITFFSKVYKKKNKEQYLKNIALLKIKIKQKFIFSNSFLILLKKLTNKFRKKQILFLQKKLNLKKNLSIIEQKKQLILNNFFFNFIQIKIKTLFWKRAKFIFKDNLYMKIAFMKYFKGLFSISFFKRLFTKNNSRNYSLAKLFTTPEYRIDIFLWRLCIYNSPFLARYAIRNKEIKVFRKFNAFFNASKILNFNFFLKQGDIIKINSKNSYSLKKIRQKYLNVIHIPSHYEIDYYLNNVIILKDPTNFKLMDLNTIIKEPLCYYKFKNYLNK